MLEQEHRPAPPQEGRRYPLSTRTTWELREKIRDAVARSGRSIAAEVEFRLEMSFRDDEWATRLGEIISAEATRYVEELDQEQDAKTRWWQFWRRRRAAPVGE